MNLSDNDIVISMNDTMRNAMIASPSHGLARMRVVWYSLTFLVGGGDIDLLSETMCFDV